MEQFTVYNGINAMITVVPMVLGAILGRPLLKLFKDPVKMTCTLLLIQAVGGAILFIAQITGLLQHAPWLFFATMFIMATGVGTDFVPQTFVQMEVVDYGIYKTGKDRSALTTVTDGFITKMQTAFSTAIVGLVLTGRKPLCRGRLPDPHDAQLVHRDHGPGPRCVGHHFCPDLQEVSCHQRGARRNESLF